MDRNEAIQDSNMVKRAHFAVKQAIEKKQTMGIPAVVYDRKTGHICHLNEDGTKVVVSTRRNRGRYSERNAK